MILRTTFENIFSFNEETSISFVAGKGTIHSNHVSRASKRDDISVLKIGQIFGPNASGKSNAVKAIHLLRLIAMGEFPIGRFEPFKLGETSKPVSKLEIEFKTHGRYFAYGVEFTIYGIAEEWLYEINSRKDKLIFTRKTDNDGSVYEFGEINGDKKFLDYLSDGTPRKKSFLSEYITRNGQGLNGVDTAYNWFQNDLCIIFPGTHFRGLSYSADHDKDFQNITRKFLRYFNTGIEDVRSIEIKSKEETGLPEDLINRILDNAQPGNTAFITSPLNNDWFYFVFKEDGSYDIFKQKTVHLNEADKEVIFEIDEESDGSVRLLDFIPMLIDLASNEKDYVIDEIDRSMHPLLTQKLIEIYLRSLSPARDSQLIITTHECSLLDHGIRPDEVWMTNKIKGATQFISLAEYKPRENVQKGYLQGRYTGIPNFEPIERIDLPIIDLNL